MPEQAGRARVVNLRVTNCDVYIGRPSLWGNPYRIGRDGTRAAVLAKFRVYLRDDPALQARARHELSGQRLGCYCAPLPCHGDLLAALVNGERW